MRIYQLGETATYDDLERGDLFLFDIRDTAHLLMKTWETAENGEIEHCIVLSPSAEMYQHGPGLIQKNVVNDRPLLKLLDCEFVVDKSSGVQLEPVINAEQGKAYILEKDCFVAAKSKSNGFWVDVLVNLETGEVIDAQGVRNVAKFTHWKIRRKIDDWSHEIIIRFPLDEE